MDLGTFNDPSKGYLIDDTCVFGAEVFVVKNTHKGDCLSMLHGPVTVSHSWKFKFSQSIEKHESESFFGGDYKWYICIHKRF